MHICGQLWRGNCAVEQCRRCRSKSVARDEDRAKKKDFAAQEQSYQKLSTPGRALVDNPIDKKAKAADPVTRSGNRKKDFAEREQSYQKLSTPGRALVDNSIDKKAKASDPVARSGSKKKDFAAQEAEFQKESKSGGTR